MAYADRLETQSRRETDVPGMQPPAEEQAGSLPQRHERRRWMEMVLPQLRIQGDYRR